MPDIIQECIECGSTFIFDELEQERHKQKAIEKEWPNGGVPPKRCQKCRVLRRSPESLDGEGFDVVSDNDIALVWRERYITIYIDARKLAAPSETSSRVAVGLIEEKNVVAFKRRIQVLRAQGIVVRAIAKFRHVQASASSRVW